MKPDLRYKRLKSGLIYPILQIPWEFTDQKINYTFYYKKRVLAVDLGLVNLTTSVICEAGFQITPPFFYKRSSTEIFKRNYIHEEHTLLVKRVINRNSHVSTQSSREKEKRRSHLLSRLFYSLHKAMAVLLLLWKIYDLFNLQKE